MNRNTLRLFMLPLALTGACGGNQPPVTPPADMAMNTADMATTVIVDMASMPADMSPPKLTFTCAAANVTAAAVYTIISNNCAGSNCHLGAGANQGPMFGASSTTMRTAVVGKKSSTAMNYIVANDVDNSYLLYKIFNQQQKVPMGNGGQMPPSAPLSTADMCTLVNWVRSGAN